MRKLILSVFTAFLFLNSCTEKVTETELMNESLEMIVRGGEVLSTARSSDFISYGDGILDEHFFLGNLVTEHVDIITFSNLSSYIFSIPIKGAYSVKSTKNETRCISGKSGALTLSTDVVIYDTATDLVDDYTIIFNKKK